MPVSVSGMSDILDAAHSEDLATSVTDSDQVSLSSIKARIMVIMRRRQELGPPSPTAQYPYPAEDAGCKYCKRFYRVTRQPLKGRDSPFLEVSRPGALDCRSCRHAKSWGYLGWKGAKLLAKIDSDDAFADEYLLIALLWEDKHNNPDECVVKLAHRLPDALRVFESSTFGDMAYL